MIYGVQGGRRLDRFLDRFLAEIRRFLAPRGRVWTPRGLILGPGEARAPLLGAGGAPGRARLGFLEDFAIFVAKS